MTKKAIFGKRYLTRYGNKRTSGRKHRSFRKTKWGTARYNIHDFTRSAESVEKRLISDPSGFISDGVGFSLNDVIDAVDFTALYESYKILYVEMTFSWSPTAAYNSSTGVNMPFAMAAAPILYYRPDYDDTVAPPGIEDLQECGNTKSLRLNPNKKYTIKISLGIQNLVNFTTLTPVPVGPLYTTQFKDRILDTKAPGPDVKHLGFKYGILYAKDLPALTSMGKVLVETKYYLRLMGSR